MKQSNQRPAQFYNEIECRNWLLEMMSNPRDISNRDKAYWQEFKQICRDKHHNEFNEAAIDDAVHTFIGGGRKDDFPKSSNSKTNIH